MRRICSRVLSILLTLVLMLGLNTPTAFAETEGGEYIDLESLNEIDISMAALAFDYWGEPIPEAFPRENTTGPAAGGYSPASLVTTTAINIASAANVTTVGGRSDGSGGYIIEGREFTAGFTISLANVTLVGCYIPGRLTISGANVKINYCEFFGAGVSAGGFEITNSNISNNTNIIQMSSSVSSGLIEGNYIHDLTGDSRGLVFNGAVKSVTVRGNSVLLGPNSYRNFLDSADVRDIVFEGNYFSGGNLILHFYNTPPVGANCKVINNTYSTFHDNAGVWGFLQFDNPTSYAMQRGHIQGGGTTGSLPNGTWQGTEYSGNTALYPEPWTDPDDPGGDPEKQYLIRFNANDGGLYTYNMPEAQRVYGLEKVTRPADPKRVGYDFGGWYKEGGCANLWDFENHVVENDMTLYAKWTSVGFKPPEIPDWYTPMELPDTTVEDWQINHDFPNEHNTGLLPGWGYPGSGAANELMLLRGIVRPAGSGEPDLRWTTPRDGGVENNPDNINPYDNSGGRRDGYVEREWVRRTFTAKPDWNHNDNATFGGSWTTWALRYGFVVVDEAYILSNGGRNADGYFVIENKYIQGGLKIVARNVIVRNCYIESCSAMWGGGYVDSGVSGNTWGGQGTIYMVSGSSLIITNCEINSLGGTHAAIWNDGEYLVAMGNNLYNSNDGIYHWGSTDMSSNYRIQDNYIHDLQDKTSNGHVDGWQAGGGSGNMISNGINRHNYYKTAYRDSGAYAHYSGGRYVLVDYNLFEGAGYTIYSYSQAAGRNQTNQWFVDNTFEDYNGERPEVGYYGVWFTNIPNDGWHRVGDWVSNYYLMTNIDPYNFDPYTTPSFRYGNVVRSTGQNIDLGNPPNIIDFDKDPPLPPGWWANSGSGQALLTGGRKELVMFEPYRASWTGEFTIEFKMMALANYLDSAIGFGYTGLTISDTANPWGSFNIIGGFRPNGTLSFHDGTAWTVQNSVTLEQVQSMTNEELQAINPYVKKYEMDVVYEIRIHVKRTNNNGLYDVFARELDDNGVPVEDWFCIGENYAFRNKAGSDVSTFFIGAGQTFTYGAGEFFIYEGAPVEKGDPYQLTVIAGENGSVNHKGGTVLSGNNISLVATPDTGYKFTHWSIEEDETGEGYFADEYSAKTTFKMPEGDVTIMAHFAELDSFNVTVTAGEGGSVNTEGGTVAEFASISITATALPEFVFKNWVIVSGSGSFANSNSAATTFTPTSDAVISAVFAPRVYYTATIVASTGGKVNTVSGRYEPGDRIDLVATAQADYKFVNWTIEGEGSFANANNASTTFTMPAGDVIITANFIERVYYTVDVTTLLNGSVNTAGGSRFEYGDTIKLMAVAAEGYMFFGWIVENGGVGHFADQKNPVTTFTVLGNATVVAIFTVPNMCDVSVIAGEGGNVNTAGGTYWSSTVIDLEAKAKPGYVFTGWTVTRGEIANAAAEKTTFKVTGDAVITANFAASSEPDEYKRTSEASFPLVNSNGVTFGGYPLPAGSLWWDDFTHGLSASSGHSAYHRWTGNWSTGYIVTGQPSGVFGHGSDVPVTSATGYSLTKGYFNFVKPFVVETTMMFPAGASGNVTSTLNIAGTVVATARLQDGVYNIYLRSETGNPLATVEPGEWFMLQATVVPDMTKDDLAERWAGTMLTLTIGNASRTIPSSINYDTRWAIHPLSRETTGDTNTNIAVISWTTSLPVGASGYTWYDEVDVYELDKIVYSELVVKAAEGGTVYAADGIYATGDKIFLVAKAMEGYEFAGWSSEGGGSFADANSAETIFTMPANPVTITADYIVSAPCFTLTVTAGSGGSVASLGGKYAEGDPVDLTAAPYAGYVFAGWTVNGIADAFEGAANAVTTFIMPSEAVLIEATFVRVYTVTFVDWDGAVLDEQLIAQGKDAVAPADPERNGYIFVGWDEDFTNIVRGLTVMAKYELAPTGASVTPSASVKVLNGNKNDLTVTVTELSLDGSVKVFTETFSINKNAAGTYQVGAYKIYVDTKGNDQIRACYIVE